MKNLDGSTYLHVNDCRSQSNPSNKHSLILHFSSHCPLRNKRQQSLIGHKSHGSRFNVHS